LDLLLGLPFEPGEKIEFPLGWHAFFMDRNLKNVVIVFIDYLPENEGEK
jgi:hypothetical protein